MIKDEVELNQLLNFWFQILPEIKSEKTELENHLKDTLLLDLETCFFQYLNPRHLKVELDQQLPDFIKSRLCTRIYFFKFLEPFAARYVWELETVIQSLTILKNKEELLVEIVFQVLEKLYEVSHKILIFELNLARVNGQLKEGNEHEQFLYFQNVLLASPEYVETICSEYEPLVELLDLRARNLCTYFQEILRHTEENIKHLNQLFKTDSTTLGALIHIEVSKGDTHKDCKSVATLVFESQKLIYKPRSLFSEKAFQKLLSHVNEKMPGLGLRTIKIYAKPSYGWVEFIDRESCMEPRQVKNYYYQLGVLLGILYSLNGVDFHFENLIASGENPVLIDLETLFHVPLNEGDVLGKSGYVKASNFLHSTVLAIGLLPSKISVSNKQEAGVFEVGGMAAHEVQKTPFQVTSVENPESSQMRLVMKQGEVTPKDNILLLNHEKVHFLDYMDELEKGFAFFYQWLLNHKELYIEKVFALFSDSVNRSVAKPTFFYAQLMNIANHPDFMTRNIHRKIVLSRTFLTSLNQAIAREEMKSLALNHIPYFTSEFDSVDLQGTSGETIKQALVKSPQSLFLSKMERLSQHDLDHQLFFMRSSYFKKNPLLETTFSISDILEDGLPDKERWLILAEKIGAFMISKGFFGTNTAGETDAFWLSTDISKMDSEDWTPKVGGLDAYNGNAGIAIFFMNLWKMTNKDKYKNIVKAALAPVKVAVENHSSDIDPLTGILTGVSSYYYVLFQYAQVFNDEETEAFLLKYIENYHTYIKKDITYDYISGNVGVLALMIEMFEFSKNEKLKGIALNIAYEVVDYLTENYKPLIEKLGSQDSDVIYSGFSHGLSGAILYTYKLYTIEKNEKVYRLFEFFLKSQRDLFKDEASGDWHVSSKSQEKSYGWCHGSPGILIEKTLLYHLGYRDNQLVWEMENSYQNTIKYGFGNNISICHGDLGNLMILKLYAKVMGSETDIKFINRFTEQLQRDYLKNYEIELNKSYVNFSGLMIGICGIGDFLLDMYSEEKLVTYLW